MTMRSRPLWRMPARRTQRGLTIVELMVSIAIGLFLLAGLISLLVSNVINRGELDKTAQQIENGRYAATLLSEELQVAGFNGAAALSTFNEVAPTPCPTSISQLNYVATAYGAGASQVPFPVYSPTTTPSCLDHPKTGAAVIVITRVSTAAPVTPSSVSSNTTVPYFQASACSTDTKPIAIDVGGGSFPLLQKDCATPALLRTIVQHMYYVSTCNVCSGSNADTTPTLKLVEYVNGSWQLTPLVEGIEDLQFDYGIDYDATAGVTGSPSCYTSDPTDGSPPAAPAAGYTAPNSPASVCGTVPAATKSWSNVVAVRAHVRARSTAATGGWTDTRTYDMGLAEGTVPATPVSPCTSGFCDSYKRHVYSVLARLNNIAGQRE